MHSPSAASPTPPIRSTESAAPILATFVQGMGNGASGTLLEGTGDTRYALDLIARGRVAWLVVSAQGHGAAQGGYGAVDDLAGNDSYSINTRIDDQHLAVVTDACGCSNGHLPPGIPRGIIWLGGQGNTRSPAAWGELTDRGGDDTYVIDSAIQFDETVADQRTEAEQPLRYVVPGYFTQVLAAQGAAFGGSTASLEDADGSDSYVTRYQADVAARGRNDVGGPDPRIAAHTWYLGAVAQGSGRSTDAATFIDRGGSADRVIAHVLNQAHGAAGSFQQASAAGMQGAGAASLFVADGENPLVRSTPFRPACALTPGSERGFGAWTDCETAAHAVGLAPGAAGGASAVAFSADQQTTTWGDPSGEMYPDPITLDVRAQVMDHEADPVAGGMVHFTVERRVSTGEWQVLWQADTQTDVEGWATAELPLVTVVPFPPDLLGLTAEYRLLAAFDGHGGNSPLRPAYTAEPLIVE